MNFRKTKKDVKLYYRYACRRLGFSGYQVHQIRLPEERLIYIPVPKNACSSTKEALHEIEFGRRFDKKRDINAPYVNIHDYYKKRPKAFAGLDRLSSAKNFTRFAVVRDPVKRLVSCYRNRVVDLGDLNMSPKSLEKYDLELNPDINTFVLNLRMYRKANKSIEHHSRPQWSFFGGSLDYIDRVFMMEELDDLRDFLRSYRSELSFLSRKSGGTSFSVSDLSDEALRHAVHFYRQDYRLLSKFYRADVHLNRIEKQQTGRHLDS